MKNKFALLILSFVLSGIAQASLDVDLKSTGGQLAGTCKVWTTWFANGRPALPFGTDAMKTSVEFARCMEYMVGWESAMEGMLAPNDKGELRVATFESGITAQQMAKVFVHYIDEHPEEENKPSHTALRHAMENSGLLNWRTPERGSRK
jgi:Rap1a immunity proteins